MLVKEHAVLGVPRDGQVRQDRPRDADLIRHHKACRRKVAEPSLVRRVTTARVFHESDLPLKNRGERERNPTVGRFHFFS